MLIDDFRAELVAAHSTLLLPLEGLRDLLKLDDLAVEARRALSALHDLYDSRRVILANAIGACDRLLADAYPTVPDATLLAAAYASVQAQVDSIGAAFAHLHPEPEAASGTITFGAAVPK